MNRLPTAKRAAILGLLVEGSSLRAASRLADVSINTVTKLLLDVASAAEAYQDRTLRDLRCRRLQCDEIWAFVYAKTKNVPAQHAGEWGYGDVWTWTAIDAETKLVPSWAVGRRDAFTGHAFMLDLVSRLAHRVQLTPDGHRVYLEAVEAAIGADVDCAMLVKLYEADAGTRAPAESRYSPARCTGAQQQRIMGNPDPAHISTSLAERQNLTMRMSMRRFTRLTNGFSKKVENHKAAVALHFMWYNFGRIHKSLRVTPAMEAGVADHVWSLEEIVGLLDSAEGHPASGEPAGGQTETLPTSCGIVGGMKEKTSITLSHDLLVAIDRRRLGILAVGLHRTGAARVPEAASPSGGERCRARPPEPARHRLNREAADGLAYQTPLKGE